MWTISNCRNKGILPPHENSYLANREGGRTDLTEAATMAGGPPDLLFRAILGEWEHYHPPIMSDSFHRDHNYHRHRNYHPFHLQQYAGLVHINTSWTVVDILQLSWYPSSSYQMTIITSIINNLDHVTRSCTKVGRVTFMVNNLWKSIFITMMV